jgi:hypothetical protein
VYTRGQIADHAAILQVTLAQVLVHAGQKPDERRVRLEREAVDAAGKGGLRVRARIADHAREPLEPELLLDVPGGAEKGHSTDFGHGPC